jgi:protein-S-isoprenylcysteine O-methyltransferase Ste14
MNAYERIFGSGPRGSLISILLLALAWWLEPFLSLPAITSNDTLRWLVFALSSITAASLLVWSLLSLPVARRGNELITKGTYRYLRHPLYAAFISIFTFGFAVFLNNWIYVLWAILVHILGHWIVRKEEELMHKAYPEDYESYCRSTGRFLPRISKKSDKV